MLLSSAIILVLVLLRPLDETCARPCFAGKAGPMRPSFVLFVVPVSICVVSCTEDNDPGQSCSDPSVCGPTASIEVDLPPSLQTFDHLVKASVTLCRNGDCVTGDFSSLNLPPSPNTGVPIALASTPDGGATSGATALLMATMNNDYWLQVFWPNTLGGAAADGDTYTLTIDDVS